MEVNESSSDIGMMEELKRTKKDWNDAYNHTLNHIRAIQDCDNHNKNSLARLNGLAQDGLGMLTTAQFNLDLLTPQLPTPHNAHLLLHSWNNQIQRFTHYNFYILYTSFCILMGFLTCPFFLVEFAVTFAKS